MGAAVVKNVEHDEPMFASAEAAVRFALSIEGRAPRPEMNLMLDRSVGWSELSALDRAAQAGMILNIIERQGRLAMAVMTAAVAPRWKSCSCRRPCCSGQEKNLDWHRAINIIAEEAVAHVPSRAKYLLRLACVLKVYGARDSSYKEIAEDVFVDEETVSKHYKAVLRWLRGGKVPAGCAPNPGAEHAIWREVEDSLRVVGIVG